MTIVKLMWSGRQVQTADLGPLVLLALNCVLQRGGGSLGTEVAGDGAVAVGEAFDPTGSLQDLARPQPHPSTQQGVYPSTHQA